MRLEFNLNNYMEGNENLYVRVLCNPALKFSLTIYAKTSKFSQTVSFI